MVGPFLPTCCPVLCSWSSFSSLCLICSPWVFFLSLSHFPILGLLLQEGREVGADGMEVGPGSGIGIIGTLSYSGAPS